MDAQGKKRLYWYTRFGTIDLREQVYRRGRGGPLVRPFAAAAGVTCRGYSLGLQRALTDFGAEASFGRAVAQVREHYGIAVPESAVRHLTQGHAAAMSQTQELATALPAGGVDRVIAETDGCFVPTVEVAEGEGDKRKRRQVGWKEARLVLARRAGAVSKRYNATLLGVERTGAQLLDCVIRVGGGQQTRVHCLGDGASWIVAQVEAKLGRQAQYLVDFYHVSEYVAAAAEAIAGAGAARWRRQQQERLKANQVGAVLADLAARRESPEREDAQAPVRVCERYLRHRLAYLDYQGALAAGLPIGSGEVESGHRSVIHARLKLSGAWWQVENAEKMLALRVTRANGEWHSYWEHLRQAAA